MTFPTMELKFCTIERTRQRTRSVIRMYRIDGESPRRYARVFMREGMLDLQPFATDRQLVQVGTTTLTAWSIEAGYDLPPDQLICTL